MAASHPECNSQKVLIIGAGIGGLVTAQILHRFDIQFEIFERAEDLWLERRGWAVGLMECLPRLISLLPEDLGDIQQTSVCHAISEPDELCVLDAVTGNTVSRVGGVFAGHRGYCLRANRERLRQYLVQNISVNTGKQFTRYVEDDQGVTAFFADGSQARGSILVGADGAYSKVRQQLLGSDHMPTLSQNIPMNGMCTLTRAEYEPLRQAGDRSSGEFYWGFAFRSDYPAADSKWAQEADQQAQFEKCLQLTQGMSKWLTSIIPRTGPEGISLPCIKFVEYVTPKVQDFPRIGRVTVLGDAAHTMIPFKGAGANTAIADACNLAELIAREVEGNDVGRSSMATVLGKYHAIMSPRGRDAVLSSRATGQNKDGIIGLTKGRDHEVSSKPTSI